MWISKTKWEKELRKKEVEGKIAGVNDTINELVGIHAENYTKMINEIVVSRESDAEKITKLRDIKYKVEETVKLYDFDFQNKLPFSNKDYNYPDIMNVSCMDNGVLLRDNVQKYVDEGLESLLYEIDRNGEKVRVGDMVRVQTSRKETQYLKVRIHKGYLGVVYYKYYKSCMFESLNDFHKDQWEKAENPINRHYVLPPVEKENDCDG